MQGAALAAHITPTQRQEILRLRAQKYSDVAIAQRLGIDRHTVGRQAGPREPSDNATGTVLTETEIARLKYIAAAFSVEGPCPTCGRAMFVAPHATSGTCHWCRNTWTQ